MSLSMALVCHFTHSDVSSAKSSLFVIVHCFEHCRNHSRKDKFCCFSPFSMDAILLHQMNYAKSSSVNEPLDNRFCFQLRYDGSYTNICAHLFCLTRSEPGFVYSTTTIAWEGTTCGNGQVRCARILVSTHSGNLTLFKFIFI